jgi:hypothetical protein
MLNQEQIAALRASFPAEALKPDTSRGFELTSIKAAYVIERLNDVFGPCGIGWRYVHSPFEDVPSEDGRLEVVTEVAFQYRCADEGTGCGRVIWNNGWQYDSDGSWSEPIFACGGKSLGRGGAPYTDARKSAVTDGLTKAASMIGVGHQVFKGLVRTNGREAGGNGRGRGSRENSGPSATTFWSLYNEQAKPLGVPMTKAKELAGNDDWAEACKRLQVLIAEAK